VAWWTNPDQTLVVIKRYVGVFRRHPAYFIVAAFAFAIWSSPSILSRPVEVVWGHWKQRPLSCGGETTPKSAFGTTKATLVIRNGRSSPIRVWWIDEQGQRDRGLNWPAVVSSNASHGFDTYVDHYFLVADSSDSCLAIYRVVEGTEKIDIE
jgi:hypothetical protein